MLRLLRITFHSYNEGNFATADYNTLEYLDHHIKAEKSNIESDWISGLEVATDFIKSQAASSSAVKEKDIILFSDLGCPSKSEKKFDSLYQDIKSNGIDVSFMWVDFF